MLKLQDFGDKNYKKIQVGTQADLRDDDGTCQSWRRTSRSQSQLNRANASPKTSKQSNTSSALRSLKKVLIFFFKSSEFFMKFLFENLKKLDKIKLF